MQCHGALDKLARQDCVTSNSWLMQAAYVQNDERQLRAERRAYRDELPPDHAEVALLGRVAGLSEHEQTRARSVVAEHFAGDFLQG